jgi:hypothetical protein
MAFTLLWKTYFSESFFFKLILSKIYCPWSWAFPENFNLLP